MKERSFVNTHVSTNSSEVNQGEAMEKLGSNGKVEKGSKVGTSGTK